MLHNLIFYKNKKTPLKKRGGAKLHLTIKADQ